MSEELSMFEVASDEIRKEIDILVDHDWDHLKMLLKEILDLMNEI